MHSRMQLPFRRAIDVVLSPEQGMQAGPMPVAPRVVSDILYAMFQGSGLTGDDVGASYGQKRIPSQHEHVYALELYGRAMDNNARQ